MSTVRAWYREPWPWLLMAGPAIVVVAGIATAVIAFKSSDGVVADDYYKQGLGINKRLAREARAAELGIAALVREQGERIEVTLSGTAAWPPSLELKLIHPTRAELDRVIPLAYQAAGVYVGGGLPADVGRAKLAIEAAEWRLVIDRGGTPQ